MPSPFSSVCVHRKIQQQLEGKTMVVSENSNQRMTQMRAMQDIKYTEEIETKQQKYKELCAAPFHLPHLPGTMHAHLPPFAALPYLTRPFPLCFPIYFRL